MSIIFKCRTRTICTHSLLNFTLISSISSAVYGCHSHIRQNFLFQSNVDGDTQIWIFGSFLPRHENKELSFFLLSFLNSCSSFQDPLLCNWNTHPILLSRDWQILICKAFVDHFFMRMKIQQTLNRKLYKPLVGQLYNGYWVKCLWLELVFMKS